MKINLGCGDNLIEGYMNIDKYDPRADIEMDMADLKLPSDSADEIVIYQALEHTPWHQLNDILTNCYRTLKPGGKLIIEVPDLEVICRRILEEGLTQNSHDNIYGGYHRPWDSNRYEDADFHKGSIHYQGFTCKKLTTALSKAGFDKARVRDMEEKHPDYRYEENLSIEAIK